MIWNCAIALIGVVALGCGAARPATTLQAGYESVPKYGDPGYQTISSKLASDEARAKFAGHSRHAAGRGWEFLLKGDLETAIRRFNQSWSMDPTNASALWGMAIVQYERSRQLNDTRPTPRSLELVNQAVALIEEAAAQPSPEASLLNDNAMILTTRGAMRQTLESQEPSADYDRAETLLRRAEAMAAHPLVYENWATLEARRGHPDVAKGYAERARQMRRNGPPTR